MQSNYILGFDWDGTICDPFGFVFQQLKFQFRELSNQGFKFFLASGRSLHYLKKMSEELEIQPCLIAGENGGHIWCNQMQEEQIFGMTEDLLIFAEQVKYLDIPQGLSEEKKSIWSCDYPIKDVPRIQQIIEEFVRDNQFNLKVYNHPDGSIDVVPLEIAKSNVIQFLSNFEKELKIHYFGDSYNDLPLMQADRVKPHCTNNSAEIVKQVVKNRGGIIAEQSFGQGVSSILSQLFEV